MKTVPRAKREAPRVRPEPRLRTFLMLRKTWEAEDRTFGASGLAITPASAAHVSAPSSASTPSTSAFSSKSTYPLRCCSNTPLMAPRKDMRPASLAADSMAPTLEPTAASCSRCRRCFSYRRRRAAADSSSAGVNSSPSSPSWPPSSSSLCSPPRARPPPKRSSRSFSNSRVRCRADSTPCTSPDAWLSSISPTWARLSLHRAATMMAPTRQVGGNTPQAPSCSPIRRRMYA